MAYDPRFIANIILEVSQRSGVDLTNLEINKIAYFVHAMYLGKFGKPLIDAKIEAWDYGPVVREIYSEFKKYGANKIVEKATKIDMQTLKRVVVSEAMSESDRSFVSENVRQYMSLGASKLVYLSHEKGGPWDRVYNASGRSNPGMEISNELIREYFSKQTRH